MSNETGAQTLGDLIGSKEFRIPMYQRNYKWNTDVAKKMVEDIVACFKEECGRKKSLGLITLYKRDKKLSIYDVIDGQQRFTTLAILLRILESSENIDLSFERDEEGDPKRKNALSNNITDIKCTDVNRIERNRNAMLNALNSEYQNDIPKEKLAEFILENVIMLCSIVNSLPVEEFMNLNAYKTAFSISDHVRANLIALNSFHKEELEERNIASVLARCLSNHSYKTAVAILYNNILEKLYSIEKKEGTYKNIYELLKKPEEVIVDPKKESRINILFSGMLKAKAKSYDSGEITENLDYWIKMLQKLALVNKLLDELKEEFESEEFHSFKQIDDYQKLTKKSFIREVFDGIDNEWDSQTLAKEIQKYSNVDSVIIRCLNQDFKKLANRYLEAFVHSEINSETLKKADNENSNKISLPQMLTEEVIGEISGCGRYIIDRYEIEHKEDLNVYIDIPPVLDLEDRENLDFGSSLNLVDTDEISIGALFKYNIKIPVIQRDYCMGARITGENDFLYFLLKGYKHNQDIKNCKLSASTVLLSVSEKDEKKEIYIFDGQQRTFTLYNILKYCGESLLKYSFIGREIHDSKKEYSSPYSKKAVENLEKILKTKISENEKAGFAKYIKENVYLKVKIIDNVTGAEQFFMDINGGVALQKHEIYKAMLCYKLSKLKREDIVRKLENEWLDHFYSYRKEYLQVSDIEDNQEDEEELLEIRFIEYVCRFVYRMHHFGIKYKDIWEQNKETTKYSKKEDVHYGKEKENEYKLFSFDEIESKGEIVAKLGYINRMDEEDVKQIENIMDSIITIGSDCSNDDLGTTINITDMSTNSSGGKVIICRIETSGDKKTILGKERCYIKRFVWSLLDKNREILSKYYKYKEIEGLIKIYDDDQIMRDILLSIIDKSKVKGDAYSYQLFCSGNFTIFGGYNHKNNDKFKIGEYTIDNKYVEEIPAYYCKEIDYINNNIIRLQYLQEKAGKNKLFFALVKNNVDGRIQYENGDFSSICLVKKDIINHDCINRTESYCLVYISEYVVQT